MTGTKSANEYGLLGGGRALPTSPPQAEFTEEQMCSDPSLHKTIQIH